VVATLGDLVVADYDGIVICAANPVTGLLWRAEDRMRRDKPCLERIRQAHPSD
jgi:regulator of RNase E activity RraA